MPSSRLAPLHTASHATHSSHAASHLGALQPPARRRALDQVQAGTPGERQGRAQPHLQHRPVRPAHPQEPARRTRHRRQGQPARFRRRPRGRSRYGQPDGPHPREVQVVHGRRDGPAHGRRVDQACTGQARTAQAQHPRRRLCQDRPALLRRLHLQHALPDLVAHRVQAPVAAPDLPGRHPHVPARVRHAPRRSPGRLSVEPPLGQRPAVRQGRPHHEGRPQQLPPAAPGRVVGRAHRPTRPAAARRLRRVRRPDAHRLQPQEQGHPRQLRRQGRRAGPRGQLQGLVRSAGEDDPRRLQHVDPPRAGPAGERLRRPAREQDGRRRLPQAPHRLPQARPALCVSARPVGSRSSSGSSFGVL